MAISLLSQCLYLATWLVMLFGLSLAMEPIFRSLSDKVSKVINLPIGLLFFALISWYLALIGIPVQMALLPIFILICYHLVAKKYSVQIVHSIIHTFAFFLLLFLIFLGFKLLVNPGIRPAYEMYMDAMILTSIARNPIIPPIDVWCAGMDLSYYYYLGEWVLAILGNIGGIPPWVVYNLALPTVFALTGVLVISLSSLMPGKLRLLPLLGLLTSSPALLIYGSSLLLIGGSLRNLFPWSLRMIPHAITENPFAALVIGAPRPYVFSMFIQVLILIILYLLWIEWERIEIRERWLCIGTLILAVWAFILAHSWDVVIYIPIISCTGLLITWRSFSWDWSVIKREIYIFKDIIRPKFWADIRWHFDHSYDLSAFLSISLLVPVGGLILALPYLLMRPNEKGMGLKFMLFQTELLPYLLVFGVFFLILIWWVRDEIKGRPWLLVISFIPAIFGYYAIAITSVPFVYMIIKKFKRIEDLFASFGLLCLLFCDLFVFVYNGPDRMNTTYKFYFMAWVLLGIFSFQFLREMLSSWPLLQGQTRYKTVSGFFILYGLFFSAVILAGVSPGFAGIDGSEYLAGQYPDEYAVIEYLRALPGDEVLVEGADSGRLNGSYSTYYLSRFSTFTGIPAILGSVVRERFVRDKEMLAERERDIRVVYTKPECALSVMNKYNATLLVVGEPERIMYGIKDPDLYSLYGFKRAFSTNTCDVWRRPKV